MGIGLLRTLLAISVVIGHTTPIFGFLSVGGILAVQSFFIISGFYMALILNEKYNKLSDFYFNRFLRLYPIYFIVLGLEVIFCVTVSGGILDIWKNHWDQLNLSSVLYLGFINLTMIGQDTVLFFSLGQNGIEFAPDFNKATFTLGNFLFVPPAWTLGLEIWFYMVAPLIVRRSAKFIFMLFIGTFFLYHYLDSIGLYNAPWNYQFFPKELRQFLLGILAYKVYDNFRDMRIKYFLKHMIILFIMSYTLLYQYIPVNWYIKHWLYCFSMFLVLPWIFKISKTNFIDRQIGDLSYIIYISHFLVINVLKAIYPNIVGTALWGIVVVVITVLFSILLQKYIQNWIDKYVKKSINLTIN